MRYGNTIVKEYPNFTSISCFNFNVVDETKLGCARTKKKDSTDQEKKRISIMRAKNKIFDIALLNDWDYFCTFTFNDKIIDAHDYEKSIGKVKKWCQNQVQRYSLRYLLVPELHPSSGRIHLHGLLAYGSDITLQDSGHFDSALRPIYNLPNWNYGFSTIIKLDDNTEDRVARYITKYITKDIQKITGNYYYAGGRNISRNCDTYYINLIYNEFEGREQIINDKMRVKYSFVDKRQAVYLGYENAIDLDF